MENKELKKKCSNCGKLEYLEQCNECGGEFCLEGIYSSDGKSEFQKGCLKLYHGSERLFCDNCFNKKSDKEKKIMKGKLVECLYDHFKNSSKRLKIVCDWDEVIQAHEPYCLWLAEKQENKKNNRTFCVTFPDYLDDFWHKDLVSYSPYGSKIEVDNVGILKTQEEIKGSSDLYQKQPFLCIAKCLVKLIKDGKVEKLIFLSAYDKRKFPEGDERKYRIFEKTFAKLANSWKTGYDGFDRLKGRSEFAFMDEISLQLIGFDNEKKGNNKSNWILENIPDVDIVIDDNPFICGNVETTTDLEDEDRIIVCSPYYPAIEKQHNEGVLLIENPVSDIGLDYFSYQNDEDEEEEPKRPFGVCLKCRQKKTVFQNYEGEEMCSDCFKKQPLKIRPLSPAFMDEDELEVFNKLSEEKQQKHFEEVRKLGREKVGDCVQCKNKGVLIVDYVKHDLCVACFKWQIKSNGNGIASSDTYLKQLEEEPDCWRCDNRASMTRYSTRELMIEVLERGDFEDITTWEDDGFLSRFKEIIAELKESQDFEEKRAKEVGEDLGRKHSKRKKYSRGV